jgi:hypothetical protein
MQYLKSRSQLQFPTPGPTPLQEMQYDDVLTSPDIIEHLPASPASVPGSDSTQLGRVR